MYYIFSNTLVIWKWRDKGLSVSGTRRLPVSLIPVRLSQWLCCKGRAVLLKSLVQLGVDDDRVLPAALNRASA